MMEISGIVTARFGEQYHHRAKPEKFEFREPPLEHTITIAQIVDAVSAVTGVRKNYILSPRRPARIAEARLVVYYVAREFTHRSFPEIGRVLKRDHTSVMHGAHKVARRIGSDLRLRAIVADVYERLEPKRA